MAEEPRSRPTCVIVADDDSDLRYAVAAALREEGFEVIEAVDGNDLSALLFTEPREPDRYDLVVSDISMPGKTGLEVWDAAQSGGLAVPFILVTGGGSNEIMRMARSSGAFAVLEKPFDVFELGEMIRARCKTR